MDRSGPISFLIFAILFAVVSVDGDTNNMFTGSKMPPSLPDDLFGFLMRKIDTAMDLDVCVMTAIQTVMPEITRRCTTLSSCTEDCPFGYTLDQTTNCTNCACKTDPCLVKNCVSGTTCRVQKWPKVIQRTHTFKAVAVCASATKMGSCPSMTTLQQMIQGGWGSSSCSSSTSTNVPTDSTNNVTASPDVTTTPNSLSGSTTSLPGSASSLPDSTGSLTNFTNPINECIDDADCMGNEKCCSDGCNYKCMMPDIHPNTPLCLKLQQKLGMKSVMCKSRGGFMKKQKRMTSDGRHVAWCVDENGLPITEYMTYDETAISLNCDDVIAPNCSPLNCSKTCPYGYIRGADHCITCQCKTDPCASIYCPDNQMCQLKETQSCATKPCSPAAQCVDVMPQANVNDYTDSHYGSCGIDHRPDWAKNPQTNSGCRNDCVDDKGCSDDMKCCPNLQGCGMSCMTPLPNNGTCFDTRRDMIAKLTAVARTCGLLHSVDFYVPACTPGGMFQEVQCKENLGMCWCVNPQTGVKVNGTKVRGIPDCETPRGPEQMDPSVCPDGIQVNRCPATLCLQAKCPQNPLASCRINPCGGCIVEFYDLNNNKVTDCYGDGTCAMALKSKTDMWLSQLSFNRDWTCAAEMELLTEMSDADQKMVMFGKKMFKRSYSMSGMSDASHCEGQSFFVVPPQQNMSALNDGTLYGGAQQNDKPMISSLERMQNAPRILSEIENRLGIDVDASTVMDSGTFNKMINDKDMAANDMNGIKLMCGVNIDLNALFMKLNDTPPSSKATYGNDNVKKNVCDSESNNVDNTMMNMGKPAMNMMSMSSMMMDSFWMTCGRVSRIMMQQMVNGMMAAPMDESEDHDTKGMMCPDVKPGMMGICVEECASDGDCAGDQMCCSNGCGHTCQAPVMMERTSSSTPYWPQCTQAGAYYDRQCRGNICWCVDSTGTARPDSFGNSSLECDVNGKIMNSTDAIYCTDGRNPTVCPNACTRMDQSMMGDMMPYCTVDLCNETCPEMFRYDDGRLSQKILNNCVPTNDCNGQTINSWQMNADKGACDQVNICPTKFQNKIDCDNQCLGMRCMNATQMCPSDACANQTCAMRPDARCIMDQCTCQAMFVDGDQTLTKDNCTTNKLEGTCIEVQRKTADNLREIIQSGKLAKQQLKMPICKSNGRFDETQDQKRSINATHAVCVDYKGQTIPNTTWCNNDPRHCPPWKNLNSTQLNFKFPATYTEDAAAKVKAGVIAKASSMGLKESQMTVTVTAGSIVVTLVLNDDPNADVDLMAAVDALQNQIASGAFNVTIDGQNFTADPNSFSVISSDNGTNSNVTPSITPVSQPDNQKWIILGCVLGAILIIVIIAVVVYCMFKNKRVKKSTQGIALNNPAYDHGPNPRNPKKPFTGI